MALDICLRSLWGNAFHPDNSALSHWCRELGRRKVSQDPITGSLFEIPSWKYRTARARADVGPCSISGTLLLFVVKRRNNEDVPQHKEQLTKVFCCLFGVLRK